ncbi:AAA family ATPase [Agrobacterium leguminum]|uniref:AAA family ATPase n=1 Tax=Agrobacterium leguminum TaxID=2792015 RepID=UPI0027298AC9|nr:AAA family ATPase [Agrobacterium leguminum]WLD99914.1 AAA family ATPase [Agrobacterium leguminum]
MRLDYVEVCGFRGFRDKVRIDFGGGFTVITGRNGVGKSTLCDAVEFAITGVIEKYTVEKAAKETLADYLWWRGAGVPKAYYVTASFIRDDGEPFTVTRIPIYWVRTIRAATCCPASCMACASR